MLATFVLEDIHEASSTEPGRELRGRIVKFGTWDDLEKVPEIEPGRELRERIVQIGTWDDLIPSLFCNTP